MAAQLMKTAGLTIITGYYIHWEPASILVTYPKDDAAKTWMNDKFVPFAEATPVIREILARSKKESGGSTALNKNYPGGELTACGVNSPSNLRMRSKRVVLKDEVDAYEDNKEGDPCDLADKRAETFHNAVIGTMTTPTIKGISRGEKKWNISDQCYYYVPCWKCGHMQTLVWSQLKWPDGAENAFYECSSTACQAHWTDQQRIAAIRDPRAEWRATFPGRKIRGRHLNGLYQLIGKKKAYRNFLHQFVEKFLEANEGGPSKLMVWTNTFLAEWWKIESLDVPAHEIAKRSEDYSPDALPDSVLTITAGGDVQRDRAEITIKGWGEGFESWAIQHIVIPGDPSDPKFWSEVEAHLIRKFKRRDGTELGIAAVCLDAGYKTDFVLEFCKPRFSRRVYAVKGSNIPAQPVASTLLRTGRRKAPYYRVGTDTAKGTNYSRLNIKVPGPGYCHFPKDPKEQLGFSTNYFVGLTAEKMEREWKKGRERYIWKLPEGMRNEPLDCDVYNLAAITILNPNWNVLSRNLARKVRDYTLAPKNPETGADAQRESSEGEAAKQDEGKPAEPQKAAPAVRRPFVRQYGRNKWGRGSGFVNSWKKF